MIKMYATNTKAIYHCHLRLVAYKIQRRISKTIECKLHNILPVLSTFEPIISPLWGRIVLIRLYFNFSNPGFCSIQSRFNASRIVLLYATYPRAERAARAEPNLSSFGSVGLEPSRTFAQLGAELKNPSSAHFAKPGSNSNLDWLDFEIN